MSDEPHILLGPYILGGLDAEDRRRFEAHLEGCVQCRAEAADFAPLPALLSKADPADLESDPRPSDTDVSMLRKAVAARRAGRRRKRRILVGSVASAVVAAAAAVVIGVLAIPGGEQLPPGSGTFAMHPEAADVTGMVTLTPRPWGTAISLDLKKLPPDGVFTLRTMDDDGRMHPAASWSATSDGVGIVEGATSIPMPKLRKLNVVDADNRVLATMER
ncbi:zf-HC2 domain-containing protein [Mycolicibacterium palauense]|uniref:zf-HC2 domain-containing protein n=1 Tax=Mycolicibacterium palauense TaxID=2034511 RepID=UPI0011455904|nr:zf-HC2 domain-containing protein [Mycolicibacterium palauense]